MNGNTNNNYQHTIIALDVGFNKINEEGIKPFIEFIEKSSREFFRAKEFVTLYDLIFKMCIQHEPYNWSEQLYEKFTLAITDYLLHTVKPSLEQALSEYDAAFLKVWSKRWSNHILIVRGLAKLFMYLDRYYTPNADDVLSLKEQGFKVYYQNIFTTFAPKARIAILNAIDRERSGESVDRQLLEMSTNVFVEMGYNYGGMKLKLYVSDLEEAIVKHAAEFYAYKSNEWLEQDSCPVYCEKAERMLNSERDRVEAYLARSTIEPLYKACYTELLKVHQVTLLRKKTGLFYLLSQHAFADLSRIYRLYKSYEEDLEAIADLFFEHVRDAGLELVNKSRATIADDRKEDGEEKNETKTDKDPSKAAAPTTDPHHALVRDLIELHADYNGIVVTCFEKAQVLQKALKKAFEEFINKDNRVSKLIAKFVNDVLKKGSKVNVRDVERTLDNVVFVYGYIQEKDIFERDYQLYLADRLLKGLCESEHNEKLMISKLKTECGYQWTNKLEGMFKDVHLSKDLMAQFKRSTDNLSAGLATTEQPTDEVQLEVNVCTTGYWPSKKNVPCHMPRELAPACQRYATFYLHAHSGHKLEWRFEQGQAEVIVDFAPSTRKALVCSTFQMIILLLFNSYRRMTFKEIIDCTGISRFEIANHLLSLCHPRVNVLLKRPNTKKLEDAHQFMLNEQYKNALKKVNIPLLKASENEDSGEEENKAIELQRRHQMDAAIVRIMKTRKKLRHAALVSEVMQQLKARFKPMPNDIKKRIEALIEHEYLERDADDRAIYNYLA